MAIKNIYIKNFTVFDNMSLLADSGINVFIGKNGTGKTQLLKLLYVGSHIMGEGKKFFSSCFSVNDDYGSLLRDRENPISDIQIDTEDESHEIVSAHSSKGQYKYKFFCSLDIKPSIYIPAKDMLTHAKGLLAMQEKYRNFPFDITLTDIIRKANQWVLFDTPVIAKKILPQLETIIDGEVIIKDEEFYIKKNNGKLIRFSAEAEGYKKIGLLWQLLMNESITKDTTLLWDEPESNLNPEYLPVIAECLLELSRQGVQIFVSTHNYLFAKSFDVRRQTNDKVTYHSLYMDNNNAVECETKHHFDELNHNAIMDAFDALLDEVYALKVGE